MTEKLKQFLKKHEDILVIIGSAAVASTAIVAYHTHVVDGLRVVGGDTYTHEDGYKIAIIHHKNGSTSGLRMEPEK